MVQFGVDMVYVPGVIDQSAFLSKSFFAYRTSKRLHVAALVLKMAVQVVLVRVHFHAVGTQKSVMS